MEGLKKTSVKLARSDLDSNFIGPDFISDVTGVLACLVSTTLCVLMKLC